MDSETDLLLPKDTATLPSEAPKDRGKFVYIIFYLLGIGTLLPWNFFSNAKEYFMYKLRNTTTENLTTTLQSDAKQTDLQIMFESYLTLAAMIPNVLFMFLNTAATHWIRLKVRISLAALVMIFMFGLAIALTQVDTDDWQMEFFAITMVTIIIMNAGSAVLQGGVFGLSGMFPKEYTQSVMGGMGMGGTIAATANIVAISLGSNPLDSGFGYFLCAELVLILALIGYCLLPYCAFSRFYSEDIRKRTLSRSINTATESEDTDYTVSTGATSIGSSAGLLESSTISTHVDHATIWQIFKKVWMYAICVFITFFITLSCYPSVNSAIVSTGSGIWADKYFMPVSCFLTFNVGDWIGRILAGPIQFPKAGSMLIPLFCFLRLFFIPMFMLCNVQPRSNLPVVFHHDAIPICLMVLFAVSNGFLGTKCMMYGPRGIALVDMETAGSLMSFFLSSGLGAGSIMSLLLIKSV